MRGNAAQDPAMISYLVDKLNEKDPNKQVGKTVVQKMVYLLVEQGAANYNYSMYHYGPYSAQVASELNLAEDLDFVDINWVSTKGYFINSKDGSLQNFVSEDKKNAIDTVVERYGKYNAIELSIITTALYARDHFQISDDKELLRVVCSVKSKYSRNRIEWILKDSEVI